MKYLIWLKENINLVSLLAGIGFIVAGQDEVGKVLINQGASL